LYDSDPKLVDSELDHYLNITADHIKRAASRYMDVDNRVVLDIIPAEQAAQTTAAASPQSPGEPHQPAAPPPLVPEKPPTEPASPVHSVSEIKPSSSEEQPTDPADVPPHTKTGSGSLHP
jgi:hypothetical protein